MLVAYLDDTGTHKQSSAVGLVGWVGTSIEWARFEQPWKKNLRVTRISCVHSADCENGDGEFFGKERPLRDALVVGLSKVIADHNLFSIGMASP
jgi:hypothetical protein